MHSIGFIMRLRSGCSEDYQKRHDNLWPEMYQAMKNQGINMVIFRHGDLLIAHVWVPSKESWTQLGELPIVNRWNANMTDLLETDEKGGIQFKEIPLVFSFGQFTG